MLQEDRNKIQREMTVPHLQRKAKTISCLS